MKIFTVTMSGSWKEKCFLKVSVADSSCFGLLLLLITPATEVTPHPHPPPQKKHPGYIFDYSTLLKFIILKLRKICKDGETMCLVEIAKENHRENLQLN